MIFDSEYNKLRRMNTTKRPEIKLKSRNYWWECVALNETN
jgi:hypothetical protein